MEIIELLIETIEAGDLETAQKIIDERCKNIPEDIKRMSIEEIHQELQAIDEELKRTQSGGGVK